MQALMAQFSESQCLLIQRNPLAPRLEQLQDSLQVIRSKLTEPIDARSGTASGEEQALANHPMARTPRSKEFPGTWSGGLVGLYSLLDENLIDVMFFYPLLQAVAEKAPDVQTWKIAIQLVASSPYLIPPQSLTSPFSGTPRSHGSGSGSGSGSMQDSDQARRKLGSVLRHELRECVYQDVDGFFERYFEVDWKPKSNRIYKRIMEAGEHVDGHWKDLDEPPTELSVWKLWRKLQIRYFTDCPGVYHTTKSIEELTGTDTRRQPGLFLKHRECPTPLNGEHDWADVRVVGQHKASPVHRDEQFFQLACYVHDIFRAQPTRRFVHAFLLLNTTMVVYVFDRFGAYSATPFDIQSEPERFVHVLAGYALMSDKELGLDIFTVREGEKRSVTLIRAHADTVAASSQVAAGISSKTTEEDHVQSVLELELNSPPIFRASAILGRGTSCYRTTNGKCVVKFSWKPKGRRPESNLLMQAERAGVRGVVRLVGSRTVTSVAELRNGLTFDKKRKLPCRDHYTGWATSSSGGSQQTAESSLCDNKRKAADSLGRAAKKPRSDGKGCNYGLASSLERDGQAQTVASSQPQASFVAASGERFHDPVLTCIAVAPAGRPLHKFSSLEELLRCFRDAIKAHRSLIVDGKILHRDISPNNIIITAPKESNGYSGMLIDLDLATTVNAQGRNERTGVPQMTGTLKYMAIEVVKLAFRDAQQGLEQTYRHDLESFFYVFLDMCVNHDRPRQELDPLRGWYVNSYKDISGLKSGQMLKQEFEESFLKDFTAEFECVKGLARSLRDKLFHTDGLYTGTPEGDSGRSSLYDSMISAFDDALTTLQ